jgi:hypothetical protein
LVGPTVVEVRLGGTTWGRPSIAIPVGTAAQLAPLPWETIDQVTITFSEPVTIAADGLAIDGVTAAYTASTDTAPGVLTLSATWTIAQKLPADRLELDLESEMVLDAAGNLLDGEWTDAVSPFPSGNGFGGGDFRFGFNVLPGDVDQNGTVEVADRLAVIERMFNYLGLPGYRDAADIDGNAKITIADLVRVRNHLGESLPAAPAASAAVLANASMRPVTSGRAVLITGHRARPEALVPPQIDAVHAQSQESELIQLRAARSRAPARGNSDKNDTAAWR